MLCTTSVDALHDNFCLNDVPRAGMSRSQCTLIDIHCLQEITQLAQFELTEVARPFLLQLGNQTKVAQIEELISTNSNVD